MIQKEKAWKNNNLLNKYNENDNSNNSRLSDLREEEQEKDIIRKKELEDYKNSLPTVNFSLNGHDFPFIQVATRPEGKVFMSKYLTDFKVPYSVFYEEYCDDAADFTDGSPLWEMSILRYWLNSDEPYNWFERDEVGCYNIDWYRTPYDVQDFIEGTPGFLRMLGLSKSDISPIYSGYGYSYGFFDKIFDYVWIPSSIEMSYSPYNKPSNYLETMLGKRPLTYMGNKNSIMVDCATKQPENYWITSSGLNDFNDYVMYIDSEGKIEKKI